MISNPDSDSGRSNAPQLSACKINQCDNNLAFQIILTWFETDRTGYIPYLFSLKSLHQRGWPCEITSFRGNTCTASLRCMTLFAGTQYEIKCRPTSWVLRNKFRSLEKYYCKYFCRPATPIHGQNRASLNLITTTLTQSTSAQPAPPPTWAVCI